MLQQIRRAALDTRKRTRHICRVAQTNPTSPDTFARNLRRVRTDAGLTKVEIAQRSRLSVRTVDRVEQGDHSPSLRTAYALSRALGCSLHELATENPPWDLEPLDPVPAPSKG